LEQGVSLPLLTQILSKRAAAFVLGLVVLTTPARSAGQQKLGNPVRTVEKKQQPKRGVREMFAEGEALFKKKMYREATAVFALILTDYPEHEPTIILFAKSAYVLGHMSDAYGLFSKIQLTQLDAESSYQYGYAFFSAKNWDGALVAFRRIPKVHALSDLANYYGGICAMRMRRFADAESMMENAAVLPEKLAKSRTVFLKHLTEIRLLHQKKELSEERKAEYNRLNPEVKEKEKRPKQKVDAIPATVSAEKYGGFRSVVNKGAVSYETKSELKNTHGYRDISALTKTTSFKFAAGYMDTFNAGARERCGYGVQLKLGIDDLLIEGKELKYLIYDNIDSLQQVQTTPPEISHIKTGTIGADPWIEYPFLGDKWVSFIATISFTYPEIERINRTGKRGGKVLVDGKVSDTDVGISSAYLEILDASTSTVSSSLLTTVNTATTLMSDLTLKFAFDYNAFTYLLDGIEGPDTIVGLGASIEQAFPLSTKFNLTGWYKRITNNIIVNSPNYEIVTADGNSIAGVIGGEICPWSWLKVKVQQTYQSNKWENIQPENAVDDWELSVPSYYQALIMSIELSKTF
jgi:tetratricopeptide (TPR) repeat protein